MPVYHRNVRQKQHIAECAVYIPSPLKSILQQKAGCNRIYNML